MTYRPRDGYQFDANFKTKELPSGLVILEEKPGKFEGKKKKKKTKFIPWEFPLLHFEIISPGFSFLLLFLHWESWQYYASWFSWCYNHEYFRTLFGNKMSTWQATSYCTFDILCTIRALNIISMFIKLEMSMEPLSSNVKPDYMCLSSSCLNFMFLHWSLYILPS